MSPLPASITIRQATLDDLPEMRGLITRAAWVHRHLDWRDALDWLEKQPIWLAALNDQLRAVLVCAAEPASVAWLRLFAAIEHQPPSAFSRLLQVSAAEIRARLPQTRIVSLSLSDWFSSTLESSGFHQYQDIVVLSCGLLSPQPSLPALDRAIRSLTPADIEAVTRVDNEAFEDIWQLSAEDLRRALKRCTYCTVFEQDQQILGYQMSTVSGYSGHLARLAVSPLAQRQGIARKLVADLKNHFFTVQQLWSVTVNTQANNPASLALYEKMGFNLTGESYPIYILPETSS